MIDYFGRMKAKAVRDRSVSVLRELLADFEDLGRYALAPLGRLKASEARSDIEPYLKHPQDWVRDDARKRAGEAGVSFSAADESRAVVLVEGVSDQLAVEALAARRGRDLAAEGVAVVPIGGAGNIRRFLDALLPRASGSPACATPARRTTSGSPSSGPASAPSSGGPASSSATPTSRTS